MTTSTPTETREAKILRYAELNALEAFFGDVLYLFDGLIEEEALGALRPDALTPRELVDLFDELWPGEDDVDSAEYARMENESTVLVARLHIRAAGESGWFSQMAQRRLEKLEKMVEAASS
ncbi:MAG: hypothetical protein ACRDOP_15950 [Gaiellaceae bacterium]